MKTDKKCKTCSESFLSTRTTQIYCGVKCKEKDHSKKRNVVRLKLIKLKGGKCEICGYKKNVAALCFHHLDPKKKEFQTNVGRLSLKKFDSILKEIKKCQLLCSNCHAEVHNQP